MEDKNILSAAKMLFEHRLNKSGLKKLPNHLRPNNIEESYKIQNELNILYLTLSDNYGIGKKVGCTNILAQKQLDIYEPFYGNIYSKFSNTSECNLKLKNFYKPYIEPEISFRIKEDININKKNLKISDANFLFDAMIPSIEIVDFRFDEDIKKAGVNNIIASNAASEYWIRSKDTFLINEIDMEDHKVDLYIDNVIADSGNTNLVLDNPINSAIWLLNKLSDIGEPMLKGQFISTGTCTKAIQINKKCKITADFGNLNKVEIEFI